MSDPIDVRQWLGDERFMYGPGTESHAKCEEAYAAVSELIEAAKEADALTGCDCGGNHHASMNGHAMTCWKFDFLAALARIQ